MLRQRFAALRKPSIARAQAEAYATKAKWRRVAAPFAKTQDGTDQDLMVEEAASQVTGTLPRKQDSLTM